LAFANTETNLNFYRNRAENSFAMKLLVPHCTVTDKLAFAKALTWTVEYFAAIDCSGTAEGTFTMSMDTFTFPIAKDLFNAGDKKCVRVTASTIDTAYNDAVK
jgi:hypothetical protein